MAVGGNFDVAQVGGEGLRANLVGLGRVGLSAGVVLQVLGGGPVAADRAERGAQDRLVVVEELPAQLRHGGGLEGQQARGAAGELGVDLGGHLLGLVAGGSDL